MRQLKIQKQITNRDHKSLDKYLTEIGSVEMITPDEEVELARRIREGDSRALEKLVKSNLRFVVSVSKQYQHQGLTLGDLINEGNVGLIKAAQKFDETRGFKFISYAVWWIRQSILQALAENARMVRLPLNRIGTLNRIYRVTSDFEQKNEREPTTQEIADLLEITKDVIEENLRVNGKHISVDAPLDNEEDVNLLDLLSNRDIPSPDNSLLKESLSKDILRSFAILAEKERFVLCHFYGITGFKELSVDEIALQFDLTRERVRQIKEKAIKKLRYSEKSKKLKMYL
jgi:RNA polymerase primary sigma factor